MFWIVSRINIEDFSLRTLKCSGISHFLGRILSDACLGRKKELSHSQLTQLEKKKGAMAPFPPGSRRRGAKLLYRLGVIEETLKDRSIFFSPFSRFLRREEEFFSSEFMNERS